MFVLALHSAYLAALLFGSLHARYQMYIALLAYAAYVLNATQFLIKLRTARLEGLDRGHAITPRAARSSGLTA